MKLRRVTYITTNRQRLALDGSGTPAAHPSCRLPIDGVVIRRTINAPRVWNKSAFERFDGKSFLRSVIYEA